MAEGTSGFDWRRDGLGLVLFGAGAFALVLVVMSLFVDVGPAGARGTTALARGLVGALGTVPALLAAVGLAVLGALGFLGGRELDLPRHALGLLGTTLGLSVLLGALGSAGGDLGAATGGRLATGVGRSLGVAAGLAAVLVPAGLAWSGMRAPMRRFSGWRRPSAAVATEADSGGVSSEEAAALVPDEASLTYMKEVWEAAAYRRQPDPIPPSPYPEDVRLKGEVPRGTQPLPSDARSRLQAAPEGASGQRRLPEDRGRTELGPGADLARPNPGRVDLRAPQPFADPPGSGTQALARPLETVPIPSAPVHKGPPKPAWEQPELFAPDSGEAAADLGLEDDEEALEDSLADDAAYDYEEELEDDEAAERVEDGRAAEVETEDVEEDEDEDEDEDEGEDEEDEDEGEYDGDDDSEDEDDDYEVEDSDEDELEVAEAGRSEAQDLPVSSEEDPEEREVVLEPRPRRARVEVDSREELVHQAGLLIAERGRVAVSLLQRSFGLDFDEACQILDELQDQGLIGPYLGGQRRDILLSLDEWRRRVPSS